MEAWGGKRDGMRNPMMPQTNPPSRLTITPSAAAMPPTLAAIGAARWMPMNALNTAALAFWVCVKTRKSVPPAGARRAGFGDAVLSLPLPVDAVCVLGSRSDIASESGC